MTSFHRLLIIGFCSCCWFVVSSCSKLEPDFTGHLPPFICENKYNKCEMVVGIESPNNPTIKYSEPILIDSHRVVTDFLCTCHLKKVENVKFFGMFCIKLYYDNNKYDLLVLSKSKKVIRFNGITYRLKEDDAKKIDNIITDIIGSRILVPAASRK